MINLPSGKVVETGVPITEVDLHATLDNLFNASLNGYLCLMIQGTDGIEEGVLIFKAGHPVAGAFEYLKYGQVVLAEEAIIRIFNAAAAKLGILDVFALTKEQVDTVLSFNGKAVFKRLMKKQEYDRMKVTTYSDTYAKKDLSSLPATKATKEDVLKKYALTGLVAGEQKVENIKEPGE